MTYMLAILLSLLVSLGSFVHYSTPEGLQNSYLTDVEIDSAGCIWVSSEAGLSRFDGYSFTNLNRTNSNLSINRINTILYRKSDNSMVVGSGRGLFIVDCTTLEVSAVTEISEDILSLENAADGCVWIGARNGSLHKLHPDGSLDSFSFDGVPESILSFLELDDVLVFGHDGGGLSTVNKATGEVKRYLSDSEDPMSLPGRRVYCIYQDRSGHLWIGTEHGLALYNPSSDDFTCFKYDTDNPGSIISDHIYSVTELSSDKLWICTDIGGISVLDLKKIHYGNTGSIDFDNIYATYDEQGLSSRNVRKVIEDDFGNVWIVHHSSGLDCIRNTPVPFHSLVYTESRRSSINKLVSSVAADGDGGIWVGLENEVARFNRDGTLDRTYLLSPYLTHSNALVYSLLKKGDYLYLGLYDSGLLKLNTRTGEIRRVNIGIDADVNGLYSDEDGSIWVGTKRGIAHLSGDGSDRVIRTMGGGSFYSFKRDALGNLWAASYGNGIYIYDKDGAQAYHIGRREGLPPIVLQLNADAKGGIWAATDWGVVHFSDPSAPESFKLYSHEEGLENTYTHGVQVDLMGNVWASSDAGISMIDPETETVSNYSSRHGVPSRNFVDGASELSPEGMVFFGSQGGICYFNPKDVLEPQVLSDIVIKDCYYFEDNSLSPSERLIPVRNGTISLHHNHKSFIVSFGVRDFSQLSEVVYEYCIPKIDDDWIPVTGNTVSFRRMPYGKYTLNVRARLQNDVQDETRSTSLNIEIEPPFLLKWWFLIAYAIIALLLIFLALQRYIQRVKAASHAEMERRNNIYEQELNKERLAFYTNITHELRTPLTMIIGPLDDMRESQELSPGLKSKIGLVRNSAGHLLDLVNQLLEFRKTESHNRKLSVKKTDLKKLLKEIGVQFKELNSNSNVDFVVDVPDCETLLYADKTVLTIILNNLLGNAAKYTKSGEIRLGLEWRPENAPSMAVISVSDTGCGIDVKDIPHIFDRFYQASNARLISGTGIGLALSKTMADLHEASLSVDSILDQGSRFMLALKVDATYPDALHEDETNDAGLVREAEDGQDKDQDNNGSSKRIVLVVEDHDDIRNYIASSLEGEYSVLTAETGSEGLEKALSSLPDIIVSDIMMPGMNGLEMCRRIKTDIRTSHVPVILLTAKDSIDDQREGYDIGADSYLTKPFSMALLTSRITNILSSRKRLAESLFNGKGQANVPAPGETADTGPGFSKIDLEFIDSFKRIVEDNISNSGLDMQYIQEEMGLSHSTLYRKVKALTGMSTIELIRSIRLSHSLKMLREEGLNVSETAYACGFNDVGHFISCFKKAYGMTPSKYKSSRPA